jgi:hypothetical protein
MFQPQLFLLVLSLSSQDSEPTGIAFNNDGTKMFILGEGADAVYRYNFLLPFLFLLHHLTLLVFL